MLHTGLFGHQLLEVKKHVGAYLYDCVARGPERLDRLGLVAATLLRVRDPVVVFERVDRLNDGAYSPYVDVNVQVVHKVGGQKCVQLGLHLDRAVDPYGWIEQHMIEQLLQQYGAVRVGQLN